MITPVLHVKGFPRNSCMGPSLTHVKCWLEKTYCQTFGFYLASLLFPRFCVARWLNDYGAVLVINSRPNSNPDRHNVECNSVQAIHTHMSLLPRSIKILILA